MARALLPFVGCCIVLRACSFPATVESSNILLMSHLRPSKRADTANGERRWPWRIGDTMKECIRIAMLVTLTVCGTIASSAKEPKPAVDQSNPAAGAPAADDNMTPYRNLAADTLKAFQ